MTPSSFETAAHLLRAMRDEHGQRFGRAAMALGRCAETGPVSVADAWTGAEARAEAKHAVDRANDAGRELEEIALRINESAVVDFYMQRARTPGIIYKND